jgi:hypothetical protein
MKKLDNIKESTIACALLVASSPALGKEGGIPIPNPGDAKQLPMPPSSGAINPNEMFFKGKNFHISSVTLDKASERKAQKCEVPKKVRPKRTLSAAFDPAKKQTVTVQFKMSKIPASQEKRVLALLYSRCSSKSPQIKTPQSKSRLKLDVRDIKPIGYYDVPAIQPAKGNRASKASTGMTVKVNFNTKHLAKAVRDGNDTIYLQAALLKKSDFEKGNYNNVILSPLETIQLTASKSCPTKVQYSAAIRSDNKVCKNLTKGSPKK